MSQLVLDEISSQTGLSNLTLDKAVQNPIAPILIFTSSTQGKSVAIVLSDEADSIQGFCVVDDHGKFVS